MLRLLRVTGFLVFALLVGLSAHRIQKQYASGEIFKEYNSERRANVTLMTISLLGVAALGFFEATLCRRRAVQRRFVSVQTSNNPIEDGLDTSNIYTAPKGDSSWDRLRGRESVRRYGDNDTGKSENLWSGLLWAVSILLMGSYAVLIVASLRGHFPSFFGTEKMACSVFSGLFALCAFVSWGMLRKQEWGLRLGYAVAIIHLLYFPAGTALGLIMIVGLVGGASLVTLSPRDRVRAARKKRLRAA